MTDFDYQLSADLHALIDARCESSTDRFLALHPDSCDCIPALLDDAHADPYFHLNFDDAYCDDDIDPIDILATMLAISDDEFDSRYFESLNFIRDECTPTCQYPDLD